MTITYLCIGCGCEHRSRIRAASREQLAAIASCLGHVLEVCPSTRTWVRVSVAHLVWRDAPPAEVAG